MGKQAQKMHDQLGMPQGTAANRLRKSILFSLMKELGRNFCFQCGTEIESEGSLSIEHKVPWMDSEYPVKLFFDLDNIAFSHLSCNVRAARHKEAPHPSWTSYKKGCRCNECREENKKVVYKYRAKKENVGVV